VDIGVGRLSSYVLKLLRDLKFSKGYHNLFVYPEFYDAKFSIISKPCNTDYILSIQRNIDRIKIAVFPDYCYTLTLKDYPLRWIFPLHSLKELDFILRLEPYYVGYPSMMFYRGYKLRDYTLHKFMELKETYGFRIWWLGANKREFQTALQLGFDGVDVTARVCNIPYDTKWNALEVVSCIESVVKRALEASREAGRPGRKTPSLI
jgi:hypothetical protein